MTGLLMILACVFSLAALGAYFISSAMSDDERTRSVPTGTQRWLTVAVVVGLMVSVGGYWAEWSLWAGVILMDAALFIFFILAMRNRGQKRASSKE